MPITVNVVSEEEYEKWLVEAKEKFAKNNNVEKNIMIAKKVLEEKK